ncbi:MAG: glycoside hydrolase family 78 protein [Bacteroidales bacterium]|nr:glycoside hydrolase family 78 protein [Bacteroidales bacterium]
MKRLSLFFLFAVLVVGACGKQELSVAGKKTSALGDSAWESSQWISAADAPVITGKIGSPLAADGASWFVATVKNGGKVVSAKWMTTALGVYELYLNGVPVGCEVLKPGFTHVEKTRRSFTYDITEAFLKEAGEGNVLSAQVTPGWWADKIVTPGGHEGMMGHKCAFRAVLELTYADGSKELFGTDCDSWKAGIAGPVKHAGIFDGETYDAREKPGYETPEKLSVPELNDEFHGEILPSEGAEIYLRKDIALKPVKAYAWEGVTGAKKATEDQKAEYGKVVVTKEFAPGEPMVVNPGQTLVVDFGQNAAAVPSFVFKAPAGTVLTCLPSEILNDGNGAESRGMDGPEGSTHRRNLRLHEKCFRLEYTFAGEGFESYYPRCTFFGYRYISVTATCPVEIKSVESIPVSSIARDIETGELTTGNDLINQLVSNTVWGQRSNYLSVPTDCPQRDERLGWTADTQVFTETGTFFANTDSFFHKWMRDLRDSQNELGAFPGVAPTAQYGSDMMRLGWADAGVIVPWTVWKQFGDKAIIEENWQAMEKFMNHVAETRYDHTLLTAENHHYQWADWLSYEPLESCSGRFNLDAACRKDAEEYWCYLGASYWAIDAGMMADMAAATGRSADAARYEAMAAEAKTYLKERFLSPDGSFKVAILNTMQTPALFALKNHLVEGAPRDAMLARLRQNFAEHDGCLQTGFLGTSILMQTLTENGMADVAYDLLFQRKNPSWLYSVDNGATTIWERWNSYTIENGMGPNGMNSFNHYAYGCVCQWLWETAAGIAADTAQPGFRHIVMKPVPDKRLGSIDATYRSAAGTIRSSWKYEGDKWLWEFTVPEGATATVTLPGQEESKDYEPGTYKINI